MASAGWIDVLINIPPEGSARAMFVASSYVESCGFPGKETFSCVSADGMLAATVLVP